MFLAFDMDNNIIFSTQIIPTFGAFTDPGVYQNILFNSINGVSAFKIIGSGLEESNTSIDNVSVTLSTIETPIPAAVWLFGSALTGLLGMAKRKKTGITSAA